MDTPKIQVGDQAIVAHEIREVTSLVRNIKSDLVIVWESKYGSGACVPSLWADWLNNGGPNY